jgi:hypothetical protein
VLLTAPAHTSPPTQHVSHTHLVFLRAKCLQRTSQKVHASRVYFLDHADVF